jgi:ubiquinone biosynthesis protein
MTDTSLVDRVVGGPAGLVRLLRRLGPFFVRYGQLLALRPDLLPPEFRDQLLLELADPSPSLPWSDVRTLLAAEISGIDSVFSSINPVPDSYNGLTQIHPAVTTDGQSVLIKFLLPGVLVRARRSGRRARALARLIPRERPLIEELTLLVERELDLTAELENIVHLAAESDSEANPCMRVPRVYPELSTARVLTRENLGGVPLIAVLSPARRLGAKSEDFDPHTLAVRLIDGTSRQILARHFYCTDLHPRNLLLLPGNVFSFTNFNHCAAVDRENSLVYTRFLNGVFSTELPRMARLFEELLIATDSSRIETMREDFIREGQEWLRSVPPVRRTRNAADFSSPLSNFLLADLRVARRNGFEVPREMLSVLRTLVDVETIAIRLDPAVHLQSTGQEILKDILLDDLFRRIEPVKVRSALVNMLTAWNALPENLNQVLTESAQGRLDVGLNATEHPHSAATRDRRYKLLAAAIAAVGVAWLIGEPGLPSLGSVPASRPLAVMLSLLYLYMIALWRRLG